MPIVGVTLSPMHARIRGGKRLPNGNGAWCVRQTFSGSLGSTVAGPVRNASNPRGAVRVPSIAAQGRMLRALLEHPPAGKNRMEIFPASFLPETDPGAEVRSNYATPAISEVGWPWITGEFRRAIGNGPPGCGKSLIIETMLPCLAWGLFGPRD